MYLAGNAAAWHAGDDDGAGAHFGQAQQPGLDLLIGDFLTVGFAQQKSGLREIGGDDVRLAHQLFHFLRDLRLHGAVQPAVVTHDRVHHRQGVFAAEMVQESGHDLDLAHRAQKAGINAVEGQVQPLPVIDVFLHGVGQVHKAVMVEPAGVVGQDGGGQGADLHPHAGQGGNDGGERRPAEAGQVVDRRPPRLMTRCSIG